MKYRSCKDCPQYDKCVTTSNLAIKRKRCEFADNSRSKKPLTNFDRIKAMSINELTQFLFVHQFTKCSHCAYFQKICSGNYFDDKSCTTGIKLYLESEVQENGLES